jgi:D-xylulose reductase
VSFAEGAMVEPLAVGMHAVNKARIKPGDVAVVLGAGPIELVTALAALAGGCAKVVVTEVKQPKHDLAQSLNSDGISTENVSDGNARERDDKLTQGWDADVVFECAGNVKAAASAFDLICPGGVVVYVGMPGERIAYDVVAGQIKDPPAHPRHRQ